MEKIVEIASKVSTPLALAGVVATLFFLLVRAALVRDLFPKLPSGAGGRLLRVVIDRFFILSLVAILLGFAGYVFAKSVDSQRVPAAGFRKYAYKYENDGRSYSGYFQELEGGSWVEFTREPDRDLTYYFREVEGEPGWITLYDSGRKSYVRLRVNGGWCQYTTQEEWRWSNIHRVTPIAP
jgi:hypothetical protein